MPLYEYYCQACDGVFETLRSIRESSEPAPCPVCDLDSERIMPTSFSAFTMRDGLPRRIPDKGTYWHINKEVKHMNTGGVPASQHPELYRPAPPKPKSKGDREVERDVEYYKQRHARRLKDSTIRTPPLGPDGKPLLSPRLGS